MSNHRPFPNSSSIAHCDYNETEGKMEICFVSGGTYKYECDKRVYEELCAAESPGKHFHLHIKPHYKGVK